MADIVKREIRYQLVDKEKFLKQYKLVNVGQESCRECPHYDKRWSCPPGLPDLAGYIEDYSQVCVIMLKVNYTPELIKAGGRSAHAAEVIRDFYYEKTKAVLLKALLKAEQRIPGSRLAGAGRCTLCKVCAREMGKPCVKPLMRRFSVTGFGLDFAGILKEEFQVELLWEKEALPRYDVAVSTLFLKDRADSGT